jgi:hypothetical protein
MSMATYQLHCERCDYSAGSGLTWGHFEYETDSGRLPVDRTLGWCNHCHGFQPIEAFNNVDEEWLMADVARLADSVKAGVWGRLWRLFGFFTREDQRSLETVREAIDSLLLASRRRGSERCLRCGSTDHQVFNYAMQPDEQLNYTGTQQTGFTHPGCGGTIQLVGEGMRFAMSFHSKKVYSAEGELLREEHCKKNE